MTIDRSQQSHANGFLFADLRDYTRFAEVHGDQAAADLLTDYRAIVREEIARSDGAEIRTEGDSFYVVFPSASAAIRTGLAILEAARTASETRPDRPIKVGIGVHAGETASTSEGLVGSAVNIAARVCALAKPGELLVTDTVRGLTRTSLPYGFVSVGARRLKGIAEPVTLYRVDAVPLPAAPRATRTSGGTAAAAIGIGVVAVVVLAVGYLVVRGAASSPTAAPTVLPQASALEPTVSAVATFPTVAEQDLLSRLPLTVHQEGQTNCQRSTATEAASGATASVHCTLPAGSDSTEVFYDQFTSGLQMGNFLDAVQNRRHLPQGDCSSGPVAWQVWQIPNVGGGKLLCYPDESGHAWVVWSYSSSVTVGRATRADTSWQPLYSWWSLNAPLILR